MSNPGASLGCHSPSYRSLLLEVPNGTIKYCQTVPNSALDRDRDTVEACRLVLGMRCRPGYKNLYLVEGFIPGVRIPTRL
jgi:hypothetical protein